MASHTKHPLTLPAILIVDDEPDIADALRAVLTLSLEADVVTAASGADALSCMAGRGFDLIISDYRMPGMDGIELLRQVLVQHPRTQRVFLTAYPEPELARRAREVAAVGAIMTKPIRRDELLARVGVFLLSASDASGTSDA